MKLICPVCDSDASTVATIPFNWISNAYEKSFGIKINPVCESNDDYIYSKCKICKLGFFTNAPVGDGNFYKTLQKFPWYYRKDKWEYNVVASYVESGQSVLDVGCGIGEFSEKLHKEVSYTGLEINPEAVEAAILLGRNVLGERLDVHKHKKANSYNVVCSFQVMEHVQHPLSMIKDMYDLLMPGGLLIIAVPNNDSYIGRHPNAILNMPPHHMLRWNESSLRKLGELLGASEVSFQFEPMDEEHKSDYLRYLSLNLIHRYENDSELLYCNSFTYKLKNRLISKFLNFEQIKNRLPSGAYPIGHTIIASIRKSRC